jgi:hypothetical protein
LRCCWWEMAMEEERRGGSRYALRYRNVTGDEHEQRRNSPA